jgi:hypothetical protein
MNSGEPLFGDSPTVSETVVADCHAGAIGCKLSGQAVSGWAGRAGSINKPCSISRYLSCAPSVGSSAPSSEQQRDLTAAGSLRQAAASVEGAQLARLADYPTRPSFETQLGPWGGSAAHAAQAAESAAQRQCCGRRGGQRRAAHWRSRLAWQLPTPFQAWVASGIRARRRLRTRAGGSDLPAQPPRSCRLTSLERTSTTPLANPPPAVVHQSQPPNQRATTYSTRPATGRPTPGPIQCAARRTRTHPGGTHTIHARRPLYTHAARAGSQPPRPSGKRARLAAAPRGAPSRRPAYARLRPPPPPSSMRSCIAAHASSSCSPPNRESRVGSRPGSAASSAAAT